MAEAQAHPVEDADSAAAAAVIGELEASPPQADSPLPTAGPSGADGGGQQQDTGAAGAPPGSEAQRWFLRPGELSSQERLLVQLHCTSPPALEQLLGVMQPDQQQRFQSELSAMALLDLGTKQRLRQVYSLLRQVVEMHPEGCAHRAFKQLVKAKCQELTRQLEEDLALGATPADGHS